MAHDALDTSDKDPPSHAARYGDVDAVRAQLALPPLPPEWYAHAMLLADGRTGPSLYGVAALHAALVYGHVDVLQLPLADERVDPSSSALLRRRVAEAFSDVKAASRWRRRRQLLRAAI
jgi:hypothetical protein